MMQYKIVSRSKLKYLTLSKTLLLPILVSLFFYGCAATTNCYTAKTLKKGEKVLTPGFDFLAYSDDEGNIKLNTETFVFPSFGAAFGLPYRFEAGVRGYIFSTVEASLRWQVNPDMFDLFDLSFNAHVGTIAFDVPYSKLGVTIGKEISKFQPFLSYYRYNFIEESFDDDDFYSNGVICFGIGIPFKKDLIIPEINYLLKNDYINSGAAFFSIGIRGMFD